MTRELVDRMRTCAAALTAGSGYTAMAAADAAQLLLEAADLLDVPEPLGEQMAVINPVVSGIGAPVWGGIPLSIEAHPCPACGSIDARTVRRIGSKFHLSCPTCANQWEYGR